MCLARVQAWFTLLPRCSLASVLAQAASAASLMGSAELMAPIRSAVSAFGLGASVIAQSVLARRFGDGLAIDDAATLNGLVASGRALLLDGIRTGLHLLLCRGTARRDLLLLALLLCSHALLKGSFFLLMLRPLLLNHCNSLVRGMLDLFHCLFGLLLILQLALLLL